MNYIMGIDIGTTHVKAGIYDFTGKLISLSRRLNRIYHDKNNNSFYKIDELVRTVYSGMYEAATGIDKGIVSICVAGMAESGLMIDKDGKPLTNIIPWFDNRNKKQLDWCKENFDSLYIYNNTGLKIQAKNSILKIKWIKENAPDIYNKSSYWLGVEDYIIYMLTGEITTEISLANRTMAMDISTGDWHKDIIDACEIKKDIFPDILHSGEKAGSVIKEASLETGIKEGIPVFAGGHDHLCAAFALGAVKDKMILNSMGTAESLVQIKKELETTQENLRLGFSVGRYVVNDLYYIIGGINNSGGAVSWFGENILDYDKEVLYEKLTELTKIISKDPTGILFLPHLSGSSVPVLNNKSKASFIGLRPEHTNAHLLKSVYEGLCYELRMLYETMNKADAAENKLIVTGGSTKNNTWMEIKAHILNKNIIIPYVEEAVCLGAAILGGLGSGIYKSPDDVLNNIMYKMKTIKPVKKLSEEYDNLYNKCYKKMYKVLQKLIIY